MPDVSCLGDCITMHLTACIVGLPPRRHSRCLCCRRCNTSLSTSPRHLPLPLVAPLRFLVVVLRYHAPLFIDCLFSPLTSPPLPSHTPPFVVVSSLCCVVLRCPTPWPLAHSTVPPLHPTHHDPPALFAFWLVDAWPPFSSHVEL